MKKIALLAIPTLVLVSLWIYLSGVGRNFVTYAAAVPPEAIAAAHERGLIEIIIGTIGIALSASVAGMLYSRHRIITTISLAAIAFFLVGGLVFLVMA